MTAPAELAKYAKSHGADDKGWIFLTGSPAKIDQVLALFNLRRTRESDGSITHSIEAFLLGPDGHQVRQYSALDVSPDDVVADVARAGGKSSELTNGNLTDDRSLFAAATRRRDGAGHGDCEPAVDRRHRNFRSFRPSYLARPLPSAAIARRLDWHRADRASGPSRIGREIFSAETFAQFVPIAKSKFADSPDPPPPKLFS